MKRSEALPDDIFINPSEKLELKEELQIKLKKTNSPSKIEVLNEQLARLEFETGAF